MTEQALLKKFMMQFTKIGSRFFRNNTGNAWTGNKIIKHANGDITIKNPRRIKFGLGVGSSDLIGWHTETITQDMVGLNVAVFTAGEVKTKNVRLTKEQKRFLDMVNFCGGIGVELREPKDLLKGISIWKSRKSSTLTKENLDA